jgi:hypothetical protein
MCQGETFSSVLQADGFQSADTNKKTMENVGFVVTDSFKELVRFLRETYQSFCRYRLPSFAPDMMEVSLVPIDFKWAEELSQTLKLTAFILTILGEHGQGYAPVKIAEVLMEDLKGLGGRVGFLWYKRCMYSIVLCFSPWFTDDCALFRSISQRGRCRPWSRRLATRASKDLILSLLQAP